MDKAKQKSILFLVLAFAVMYTCCVGLGIYCENAAVYDANFWIVGILIFSYLLSFYFVYRSKCIVACALADWLSILLCVMDDYVRFFEMIFFPWSGTAYWIGIDYRTGLLDLSVAICTTVCLIIMIVMNVYKLGVWKVPGQDSGIKILHSQIQAYGKSKAIRLVVIAAICLIAVAGGLLYLFVPIDVDYEFVCESTPATIEKYYDLGYMYTCKDLETCGQSLGAMGDKFIDEKAYKQIADSVDFEKYFVVVTYNYEIENIICNNYKKINYYGYPEGKLIFKEVPPQYKAYIYAVSKTDIQGLADTVLYYNEEKNSFNQKCYYTFIN